MIPQKTVVVVANVDGGRLCSLRGQDISRRFFSRVRYPGERDLYWTNVQTAWDQARAIGERVLGVVDPEIELLVFETWVPEERNLLAAPLYQRWLDLHTKQKDPQRGGGGVP